MPIANAGAAAYKVSVNRTRWASVSNTARQVSKRFLVVLGAAIVALGVGVSSFALPRLEHYFLLRAGEEKAATLRLAVESLRLTLERYAPIPALIAARPEIAAVLGQPDSLELQSQARDLLAETAIALRASGVYLEDGFGNPLVAVPPLVRDSGSAAYRPYFDEAVAGGVGQYYALGTQTGERGFYYAAPVRINNRIRGIVSVTFDVDQFEATWREGAAEIIVRDSNDIVFMSSRPDWNFRSMRPLPEEKLAQIEAAGQFPVGQIQPLANETRPLDSDFGVVTIGSGLESETFITSTQLIARAGWRVSIMMPTAGALAFARTAGVSMVLMMLLVGLSVALLLQRRSRLQERMAAQKAAQEMLEARVVERTAELNAANSKLTDEVAERRAAEEQLRQTQAELVQAGKLAGLGQMSAALSHELNQPLTAVKSYAENALTFIERGRIDDAAGNVRQISTLADRMSSIARHLRNFARRPQEKTSPVDLFATIDDALSLMQPKIGMAGVVVRFDRTGGVHWVIGGRVRLQQVIVNLISNALDAMADDDDDHGDPTIWIAVMADGNQVHVDVRDNGPGISDKALTTLFDPFFTTKEPGRGLGLGLSISFNIVRDFNGQLSASNHADGGAVFRMTLMAASPVSNDVSELVDAAQ